MITDQSTVAFLPPYSAQPRAPSTKQNCPSSCSLELFFPLDCFQVSTRAGLCKPARLKGKKTPCEKKQKFVHEALDKEQLYHANP